MHQIPKLKWFSSRLAGLCPIYWGQVLSREWRCSCSSTDRRCCNYIWVINNFIAYSAASNFRGFTVDYENITVSQFAEMLFSPLTRLTSRGKWNTEQTLNPQKTPHNSPLHVLNKCIWYHNRTWLYFHYLGQPLFCPCCPLASRWTRRILIVWALLWKWSLHHHQGEEMWVGLTLKHRETHGCVVSTVATDGLLL